MSQLQLFKTGRIRRRPVAKEARAKPTKDEWYTPRKWYLPWHREFHFTLDVCATPASAKCVRYFTKRQNGLRRSWAGERVWQNPPYSAIPAWTEKTLFEVECNGCELAVQLLPAWPDRAWWHDFVVPYLGRLVEPRWIRGRIRFGDPGDPEALLPNRDSGMFPSVLLIWRPQ